MIFLRELVEAGDLRTVVDRCYPLEQAAEAHRYVETGQKKGHVILAVQHEHVEPDGSAAQTGTSQD